MVKACLASYVFHRVSVSFHCVGIQFFLFSFLLYLCSFSYDVSGCVVSDCMLCHTLPWSGSAELGT